MTTAFVAGATGYTGQEVVRQLASSGSRAIAHVRPDSPALASWRARFEHTGAEVDTTPWQLAPMTAALRAASPDMVFALLGTTRARARAAGRAGEGPSDYEAVDYGLTHLLLEAARSASPHATFIYLSSLGVQESTRNPYLRARVRIEEELRGSGLSFIVARPGLITGSDRAEQRRLEHMLGAVLDGAAGILDAARLSGAADRIRPIAAAQLARALIAGASQASRTGVILGPPALQRMGRG